MRQKVHSFRSQFSQENKTLGISFALRVTRKTGKLELFIENCMSFLTATKDIGMSTNHAVELLKLTCFHFEYIKHNLLFFVTILPLPFT